MSKDVSSVSSTTGVFTITSKNKKKQATEFHNWEISLYVCLCGSDIVDCNWAAQPFFES